MHLNNSYKVNHRQSLKSFIKNHLLSFYLNFPDVFLNTNTNTNHPFGFVCGCGHSGTTLLASRLGDHPSVFLLPRETYAFIPPKPLICSKALAKDWEAITLSLKKTITIEKTPKHIQAIERIEKTIRNPKFIIITRNPLDTIASLYERSGCLRSSIERWKIDNKRVIAHKNDKQCLIIKYEDLVTTPAKTLENVCNFLHIEHFEDLNNGNIKNPYGHRSLSDLERKRSEQVAQPITNNINSWKKRITSEQAQLIIKNTKDVAHVLGYDSYLSLN